MALKTKPRWDKFDGYIGNPRGHLAVDIPEKLFNKVLAVGVNSDGAIVVGAGNTGIKGLMIVSVGADIHGNYLDGGINHRAGDPQDVGKHGEITNFVPTVLSNSFALHVDQTDGNYTVLVNGVESGNIAHDAIAATLKAALVAIDDGFDADDFTVTGTAPDFTIVTSDGITIGSGEESTVTAASNEASAGTNYYGHADGSVTATKGVDGVYVGHTMEKDRLIVNVDDEQD